MYFCIYLDIPELESWVIAEPHAPALARRRLSLAAGYLPVGFPDKEPALARAGAARGDLGAGVCVPGHIPLASPGALASETEVRCWRCKRWAGQGELLVPARRWRWGMRGSPDGAAG